MQSSNHFKYWIATALLTFTLLQFTSFIPARAAPLGISVDVLDALPSAGATATSSSASGITLLIKPGESVTKYFRVRNLGNVASTFSMSMELSHLEDGIATLGDQRPSEMAPWTTTSPPSLTLDPGKVGYIKMAIAVPHEAPIGIHMATLFVTDNPANPGMVKSEASGQISISMRSNIRQAFQLTVGVGTSSLIPTNFRLLRLREVFSKGQPFYGLQISNIGKLPVEPLGTLKVADPTGAVTVVKESRFQSPTIQAGTIREIYIPIEAAIPAGKWLVTIVASEGILTQTLNSELSITHVPPYPWKLIILALSIMILSLALVVAAVRLWPRGRSVAEEQMPLEEATGKDRKRIKIEVEKGDDDLEALLQSMLDARKKLAPKKRATIKKAAPKKKAPVIKKAAPKKKAPVKKKAIAKKSAPKRK